MALGETRKPSRSGHVLIVEDDQSLATILRAHMVNSGFRATISHNGEDGLEIALREVPDVIILDIQLPGLDGLSVTRALRENEVTKDVPVILITARSGRDDIVLGLDAGAQDYVVKPFDVVELTARVRSMLKLRSAQLEIAELNHQLEFEVAKKSRRLELLYTFVRDLNKAPNQERIYDLVTDAVRQVCNCNRISIMVLDPATNQLKCKRALGVSLEVAEQMCVQSDAGIAGKVFSTGTTMVARAHEKPGETTGAYLTDSFLSTPLVSTYMVSGSKRLGVLNVTDKVDGEPFAAEEIDCICSIADSAAIALHNAEQRSDLKHTLNALLSTVGRLSEYRDEETGLHLERVKEYTRVLTRRLANHPAFSDVITCQYIDDIYQAAPLHDLGKVGVSDEILNKPGPLTDEEFQIMKTHTTIGRHTLALAIEEAGPVPLLELCADIAYCHHERYDGKGYPRGIAGDDIPLSARIIALVDAYDAITSQRCYKQPLPHAEAVKRISEDSGKHFDARIVEAFLEVESEFDEIRQAKADSQPAPKALKSISSVPN
ncbi:MAG TPA: response regulator [Phycisphaerae bacterium]|nr:response regulator [Phycisphaerae bacterium]